MSCGTGECGYGCEDSPFLEIKVKEREGHLEAESVAVADTSDCCEPICGPTTCQ